MKKLDTILFIDIETVPNYENWKDVPEVEKKLFETKTKYLREKDKTTTETLYTKAGIWAEFGKIICISVGYFLERNNKREFRITSFAYNSEKETLTNFCNLLNNHFNRTEHILCAHNGKEFDFPFIARRMVIHQIELPKKLRLFGKKPWEIPHLDTLELWKFGDYKHYTSLNLLTYILNIPSPKQDIDGSEVNRVYYKEKNISRIIKYCEKDVVAVAQLLLRFNNFPLLDEQEIIKSITQK